MTDFSYREYVADQRFLDEYNAYQGRYAQQMRESDKVLVGLVRKVVESRGPFGTKSPVVALRSRTLV